MSELITVRVQVGVNEPILFSKTVQSHMTMAEMRHFLRKDQDIDSSFGVVLIYNGCNLKDPDVTLYDLGICNDSLIICIISRETGREIEALLPEAKDENYETLKPVLECEFSDRPLGFAVWANELGEDAIVTKVSGENAIKRGIKIGYCIYKVNDTFALNKRHDEVLGYLKNMECPLRVQFLDLGNEQTFSFDTKPLGFTVVQDKEDKNAKVSKLRKKATKLGVKIGSHVVAVNDQQVFGWKHKDIIDLINKGEFPIELTFRQPPKLQVVSSRRNYTLFSNKPSNKASNKLSKKKGKIFSWANR